MKAKTGLLLFGGAAVLVALAAWRVKSAASAAGSAISGVAGAGWVAMNNPVWDASIPGASVANAIVAAPANTIDALSFGTIGGTGNGSGGVIDTLKAGPFGGLVGILSGDGNTNFFGPAPAAGLDFGNGTGNW
jgi:hypothetical protein